MLATMSATIQGSKEEEEKIRQKNWGFFLKRRELAIKMSSGSQNKFGHNVFVCDWIDMVISTANTKKSKALEKKTGGLTVNHCGCGWAKGLPPEDIHFIQRCQFSKQVVNYIDYIIKSRELPAS